MKISGQIKEVKVIRKLEVGRLQNRWIRFVKGFLVIKVDGDYMERFLICAECIRLICGNQKRNRISACVRHMLRIF